MHCDYKHIECENQLYHVFCIPSYCISKTLTCKQSEQNKPEYIYFYILMYYIEDLYVQYMYEKFLKWRNRQTVDVHVHVSRYDSQSNKSK